MQAYASEIPITTTGLQLESGESPTTLTDFIIAIDKLDENKNFDNINNAIDTLRRLKNPEDPYTADERFEYTDVLLEIITDFPNTAQRREVLETLAKVFIGITQRTMSLVDEINAEKVVLMLPKSDIRTELSQVLTELRAQIEKKMKEQGLYDDGNIPEDWLNELDEDDFVNPNEGWEDDGYKPGYGPNDGNNNSNSPNGSPINGYLTKSEYVVQDGICYKITRSYDANNKQVGDAIRQIPTGAERGFCPFITPDTPAYNPEAPPSSGSNGHEPNEPYKPPDFNQGNPEEPNKTKEKVITIQYTLDKNSKSLHYFDTSLEVSEENTISYFNARDILQQIAIKSGEKFIDDKDKCMAVLEGNIIVIKNIDNIVSVDEFIKQFEQLTRIKVVATNTKFGQQHTALKGPDSVVINGADVKIGNIYIINNRYIISPIENIAVALGASITKLDNKLTINYKDKEIIYERNKDTILVNGESVQLDVPTQLNSDSVMLGQIEVFLKNLDSGMYWDSHNEQIVIITRP